jgi:hypothetical protein
MSIRKAIQDSEVGCASGDRELWKCENEGFRVLDLRSNETHFISEERLDGFERLRNAQDITFKPMKRG